MNDHNLNSITGIWLENLPKFLSGNDLATQSGVLNHQKILAGLYGAIAYQKQNDCKESFDKNTSDSERISVLMEGLKEGEPYILNQNLLDHTGASCKELKQFVTEYGRNSRAGLYEEDQLDKDYEDFLDFVWSISIAYIKVWDSQHQSLKTENINTIDDCIRSWDVCSRVLDSSWSRKLKNKYAGSDGNWSWYVRKLIDE